MNRSRCSGILVLCCVLAGFMVLGVSAETVDGPYYVVDVNSTTTGHVYTTLVDALTALEGLSNPEEAVGATIIVFPGQYKPAAAIDISIPGLRIMTRDGADRTEFVAASAGPLFTISAPGVMIEGLKITGMAGSVGIRVQQPDCVLKSLMVTGHGGAGIEVVSGADRFSLADSDIFANGASGIDISGVWGAQISGATVRSNGAQGIALSGSDNVNVENSTITGNGAFALNVSKSRNVVVEGCSANNGGNGGFSVASSTGVHVLNNIFSANAGSAVILTSASSCVVEGNTISENMGAAVQVVGTQAAPSTLNVVKRNTISLQAGTNPLPLTVPGILLAGSAQATTLTGNVVTGYMWGVVLNAQGGAVPQGNRIESNTVQSTISDGIRVLASGGDNILSGNTITNCAGNGVLFAAASNDQLADNSISGNTLSGLRIGDGSASVGALTVSGNSIQSNGAHGIAVVSSATPNAVMNLVLTGNTCSGNDDAGLDVQGNGTATDLRVLGNMISENEAGGAVLSLCPGAVVRHNEIYSNQGIGLSVSVSAAASPIDLAIERNSVHHNVGGGLSLNLGGGTLVSVIQHNAIYDNLGFGVELANLPTATGKLPYPENFSLGSNWWGVSVGPSGLFAGTGNAILGLPGNQSMALAPILPAPSYRGASADAGAILSVPQVSVLNSFAASKVVVDRVDTTGFRLTFTGVPARNSGWISTAAFTKEVVQGGPWNELGTIYESATVLVAGLTQGTAEVACEFDPSALPENLDPSTLRLFAYKGGAWSVSNGEWILDGGAWTELSGCVTVGAQVAFGELQVADLLGNVKAIALAAPAAPQAVEGGSTE